MREDLCRRYDVPCTCIRADAAARAKAWRTGVEEAGRRIRYEGFEQVRASLERERGRPAGSRSPTTWKIRRRRSFSSVQRDGPAGAGGMLPVNGNLIRPLLMENRTSIEEYLDRAGPVVESG